MRKLVNSIHLGVLGLSFAAVANADAQAKLELLVQLPQGVTVSHPETSLSDFNNSFPKGRCPIDERRWHDDPDYFRTRSMWLKLKWVAIPGSNDYLGIDQDVSRGLTLNEKCQIGEPFELRGGIGQKFYFSRLIMPTKHVLLVVGQRRRFVRPNQSVAEGIESGEYLFQFDFEQRSLVKKFTEEINNLHARTYDPETAVIIFNTGAITMATAPFLVSVPAELHAILFNTKFPSGSEILDEPYARIGFLYDWNLESPEALYFSTTTYPTTWDLFLGRTRNAPRYWKLTLPSAP
jgi:hypothetical protein